VALLATSEAVLKKRPGLSYAFIQGSTRGTALLESASGLEPASNRAWYAVGAVLRFAGVQEAIRRRSAAIVRSAIGDASIVEIVGTHLASF
jgi:hypothetical protein